MPNAEQQKLAKSLGINIARDKESIAAARLMDGVAEAIGLRPPEPSTENQQNFAASLGKDVTRESKRVTSAIIDDLLFERNQARLKELQIKPGDRVIRTDRFDYAGVIRELEREFVVSSIHPSGRIYFKGGNGQGAWPTQVRKVSPDDALNSDVGQSGAG